MKVLLACGIDEQIGTFPNAGGFEIAVFQRYPFIDESPQHTGIARFKTTNLLIRIDGETDCQIVVST